MIEFVRVLNNDIERDVRESALFASRKDYIKKSMSKKEWFNYLIKEHSVIETILIKIRFCNIKKDVASHLVRHTKNHPRYFMQTSRPDIVKKERDPDELIGLEIVLNPLALINMARQRLCFNSQEATRKEMIGLKNYLLGETDAFLNTLGFVLVPDCVYRGAFCSQRDLGLAKCCYNTVNTFGVVSERYAIFAGRFN
ncbi:MAG: hypothetical protein GF311_28090 [Candidatus Lokiarchaeota archaeon]|nr:hypothetical protein [Candidatus Lokiarchaeota archaeon]